MNSNNNISNNSNSNNNNTNYFYSESEYGRVNIPSDVGKDSEEDGNYPIEESVEKEQENLFTNQNNSNFGSNNFGLDQNQFFQGRRGYNGENQRTDHESVYESGKSKYEEFQKLEIETLENKIEGFKKIIGNLQLKIKEHDKMFVLLKQDLERKTDEKKKLENRIKLLENKIEELTAAKLKLEKSEKDQKKLEEERNKYISEKEKEIKLLEEEKKIEQGIKSKLDEKLDEQKKSIDKWKIDYAIVLKRYEREHTIAKEKTKILKEMKEEKTKVIKEMKEENADLKGKLNRLDVRKFVESKMNDMMNFFKKNFPYEGNNTGFIEESISIKGIDEKSPANIVSENNKKEEIDNKKEEIEGEDSEDEEAIEKKIDEFPKKKNLKRIEKVKTQKNVDVTALTAEQELWIVKSQLEETKKQLKFREQSLSKIARMIQAYENEEKDYDTNIYFHLYLQAEYHHKLDEFVSKFRKRRFNYPLKSDSMDNKAFGDSVYETIGNIEKDEEIRKFVGYIVHVYGEELKKISNHVEGKSSKFEKFLHAIIVEIVLFFYPNPRKFIPSDDLGRRNKIIKLQNANKEDSFIIKPGDLKAKNCASCRHFSFVLKHVLDQLETGVRCRLFAIPNFHAFNYVIFGNEEYLVDVTDSLSNFRVSMKYETSVSNIKEFLLKTGGGSVIHRKSQENGKLILGYLRKNRADILSKKKLRKLSEHEVIQVRILEDLERNLIIDDERLSRFLKLISEQEPFQEENRPFRRICRIKLENDEFSANGDIMFRRGEISFIQFLIETETEEKKKFIEHNKKYGSKEAQSLRNLRKHKNIVQTFQSFEFTDKIKDKYLCIPFISNSSTDENIKEMNGSEFLELLKSEEFFKKYKKETRGRKSTRDANLFKLILVYQLLFETARGLRFMHACEYSHSNVEPKNILVLWNEKTFEIESIQITGFWGVKDIKISHDMNKTFFGIDENHLSISQEINRKCGILQNILNYYRNQVVIAKSITPEDEKYEKGIYEALKVDYPEEDIGVLKFAKEIADEIAKCNQVLNLDKACDFLLGVFTFFQDDISEKELLEFKNKLEKGRGKGFYNQEVSDSWDIFCFGNQMIGSFKKVLEEPDSKELLEIKKRCEDQNNEGNFKMKDVLLYLKDKLRYLDKRKYEENMKMKIESESF